MDMMMEKGKPTEETRENELIIESCESSDTEWDKRVFDANGFIYQTAVYAEYMKEALGMKPLFLTVREGASGKIVGQLAIHYGPLFCKYLKDRHNFLFNRFLKMFKVYHFIKGPVIFDESLKKKIYTKLIEYMDDLGKKAYMLQDLSLPLGEDESIYQLFYDKGFYSDSWGTILIDTIKEPRLENLEKGRRNSVNKGKRQGLEVKEAKSEEDYDKVITIIEDMSRRNKIFAHPRKYYHILFKILGGKGMLKTFFIEKDGHGIATLSVYLFGKRAIQTLVAHTEYSIKEKISGTDFLEWHTIKWCHDLGYETYDLAGIRPDSVNKKDTSLKEYKMRWGSQVVRYPYFSKVYSKPKEKLAILMRKLYKK